MNFMTYGQKLPNPQILRLILLGQIRIFLRFASQQIANPKISTKYCTNMPQNSPIRLCTVLTVDRLYVQIRALHAIFCKEKKYVLRTCGSFMSANHKKDCVHKLKIFKMSHLRKVRKSNQLLKSANLLICDCEDL
jgi:hypothetical protein